MALSIKDAETEQLARALAQRTGESITMATKRALEERLQRLAKVEDDPFFLSDLKDIRLRWAALPILDRRTADEIVGYDEHGAPS